MESFDQSLKYLLQHEPADFIRFALDDPTVEIIEPVPSVLPARGRDVDGAYLITRGRSGEASSPEARVAHIELHRRHQGLEELAVDVAEAQLRLFRRERKLVLSHVWDLYGDPNAPVLESRALRYGDSGSQCIYQRVNLRGLGWEELLSHGPPALWPLVPLTRDGADEAVIEKACNAIEAHHEWSSTEQADHLAVLWFVAEAESLPTKLMQLYLSEARLMESMLYKSIFEKGEAKGEARGEAKAYAELLVKLLIHRLGMIGPAIRERVRVVSDVDILKAWYDEALFATDAAAAQRLTEKIEHAKLP